MWLKLYIKKQFSIEKVNKLKANDQLKTYISTVEMLFINKALIYALHALYI